MYRFKGFASIPVNANNADGQTAVFGEISNYAHTFSRHKSNWANATLAPNIELVAFRTVNDSNAYMTPSNAVVNHILSVTQWVYTQYAASAIPSNANQDAFIASLVAQFPAITAGSVLINEIIADTPSTKRMPDHIQWDFLDADTKTTRIKIWFNDSRFRTQYDDYEILLVPPLTNIDQLNNPITTVQPLLAAVTPDVPFNAIGALVGDKPSTVTRTYQAVWSDATNPGATIVTNWYAAIYGQAGNDADALKYAVREYISAHSTLSVWSTLYPALYADNEFVIVPMWGDVASPMSGLDPALYRSSLKVATLKTRALALIPGAYANMVANIGAFLDANLTINAAFWRSIMFLAVGSPSNTGGHADLTFLYPDYMDIPSTDADFARMTATTQGFIVALNDALQKAMDLTASSPVPPGYMRTVRSNKVYLSFQYDGYTYLVLAQTSYS